jgi:serine/threonine protein kinase
MTPRNPGDGGAAAGAGSGVVTNSGGKGTVAGSDTTGSGSKSTKKSSAPTASTGESPAARRKRGRSLNSPIPEGIQVKHNSSGITSDAVAADADVPGQLVMSQESEITQQSVASTVASSSAQDFSQPAFGMNMNLQFRDAGDARSEASTMDGFSNQFSDIDSRSNMLTSSQLNFFNHQLPETVSSMRISGSHSAGSPANGVSELISVPAPAVNPFMVDQSSMENMSRQPSRKSFAPTRYMLDFEEEFLMGEGNFSRVMCARNRIDGIQYAIKKLGERSTSDAATRRLTKEVCALAVLQGCPQIIRYFSSWIEDGRIYIQTELCNYGNMDMFIVTPLGPHTHADLSSRHIASRGRSLSAASNNSNSNLGFPNITKQSSNTKMQTMSLQIPALSLSNLPVDMDTDTVCTPKPHSTSSTPFGVPLPTVAQRHGHGQGVPPPPITAGVKPQLSSSSISSVSSTSTSTNLNGISESLGWLVLFEMSQALAFMHARNMAHMDIRPANIFITSSNAPVNMVQSVFNIPGVSRSTSGSDLSVGDSREIETASLLTGQHLLKLGDFGHTISTINVNARHLEEGDARYVSREVLEQLSNVDVTLGDMFSLGASVYELCLGRSIQGESEEWHDIRFDIKSCTINVL